MRYAVSDDAFTDQYDIVVANILAGPLTVLAPAIAYAHDGFAVTPRIAYEWDVIGRPKLARNAHAARHWLSDGAPRAGTT